MNFPFTKNGFDRAKKELHELMFVERPEIIAEFSDAKSSGDPEEDTGIQAVQERQDFIDRRIDELQKIISNAVVIDITANNPARIAFGATVTLVHTETNKESVYTIVGSYESDPNKGLVSYLAPLGAQLLGKEVGDEITIIVGNFDSSYEIVKIAYDEIP